MRRPGGADFAPGAYVFPGGVVHEEDSKWGDEIAAAAVRELVAGGTSFSEALRSTGLEPALDRLVLLTRWVTPSLLRRRYDARFYLARLPASQSVRVQTDEVTDWLWITAERALTEESITLVYATRKVLESVAPDEVATGLFARVRRLKSVPVVEPRMVQTDSGWEIVR